MADPRLAAALADRYRLERELGAGGMAVVYLAEDLRHGREVAIKVLHPELSAVLGPERFLAEIKLTAALQHPHILPLFDSGSVDGLLYYVMPYVAGETLRTRLAREHQLPVEDAVRITLEVADALGYAHAHGVIHRDIKPDNILLQRGHALVADFGVALAVQQAGGKRMTLTGLSVGTPQYMSPEQAMGERSLDARSDIYALGAVTYEMLTGQPPFTGSSAQAIVARIVTEKPASIRAHRDTVPPHVEHAVLRALAQLPADRYATAEQFSEAMRGGGYVPTATAPAAAAVSPRSRTERRTRLLLGGMALVTAASLVLAALAVREKPAAAGVSRYVVRLERHASSGVAPILSPDDRVFAYGTPTALLLRHEGTHEPVALPGTALAWAPFYSPDGGSIGFINGYPGDLKVIDLATNAVRTVVHDSAIAFGGSWGTDGKIYFTSSLGRAILRVSADGGEPELVARVDTAEQELGFRWPQVLPGARGLIMTRWRIRGDPEIVHLDLRSGRMRVLTGGLQAWYVESGHLAIARGSGVMSAMRFDAGAGEIEGRAVDLDRGFRVEIGGIPTVGVSPKGTLVYRRSDGDARLLRVTRAGRAEVVDSAMRGQFNSVALSPDGSRAAIAVMADGRAEIWVKALDDGPFTRTITAGTLAYRPSWSTDGRSILFTSDLRGLSGIFSGSADGGAVAALPEVPGRADEASMTRDGRWLVFRSGSGGRRNIYRTRLDGDATAQPIAAADDEEYSPHVSPDGRWLAYGSNGSGQDEVFVTPFDGSGGRIQVSVAGGNEPLWSRSGRELFYRDLNDNLVSATVAPGNEFRVLSRRVLFSTARYRQDARHRAYDVSPDDESFYFVDREAETAGELVVVRNWMADASARME